MTETLCRDQSNVMETKGCGESRRETEPLESEQEQESEAVGERARGWERGRERQFEVDRGIES